MGKVLGALTRAMLLAVCGGGDWTTVRRHLHARHQLRSRDMSRCASLIIFVGGFTSAAGADATRA